MTSPILLAVGTARYLLGPLVTAPRAIAPASPWQAQDQRTKTKDLVISLGNAAAKPIELAVDNRMVALFIEPRGV